MPVLLRMAFTTTAVIVVILAGHGPIGARAQSPPSAATPPSFEVASVKANKSGSGNTRIGMQPGGRFVAENISARELIRIAYQMQPFQIDGGPGWITVDRFDINAKAEGDVPPSPPGGPPNPMLLMLRGLLAERFQLETHREEREKQIYALVRARADGKLGPQLTPASVDCAALATARGRGAAPAPPAPGERPMCGFRIGPASMAGGGVPITQLSSALGMVLGNVVQNRTELSGNYDIELSWTPDPSQGRQGAPPGAPGGGPTIDPSGPSIFTALQEQLGLKLESQRAPVEMLVIDRIERPTED